MKKPVLNPDERQIDTYRANRSQGSRAVGGRLLLTSRRVAFHPHKLDNVTGGNSWECDLTVITDVGLSERGSNPFNGSMRRRLKIESAVGTEYFVVNKAEEVASSIRSAMGR